MNEVKAMAKMIYLHFRYAELKGEKMLYRGITVDNVNEFSKDELDYIFEIDSELNEIQKKLC